MILTQLIVQKIENKDTCTVRYTKVWQFACDIFASKHQGAFHVVNPDDLLRGFQKRSAYLQCDRSFWRAVYLVYFIWTFFAENAEITLLVPAIFKISCVSMPVPPYTDCVKFPKRPCENRQSVNHLISFYNGLKNWTALVSTSFEQESGQAVSSLWTDNLGANLCK